MDRFFSLKFTQVTPLIAKLTSKQSHERRQDFDDLIPKNLGKEIVTYCPDLDLLVVQKSKMPQWSLGNGAVDIPKITCQWSKRHNCQIGFDIINMESGILTLDERLRLTILNRKRILLLIYQPYSEKKLNILTELETIF